MEEDGDNLTPFWIQSTANHRRADRLRRRVSAFFFSSGLVVFLLLLIAVFFLVFVVPSTISFTAQIFRPNSIKKSWDSFNILLVLVAVIFGFLSRNKNEDRYTHYDEFQSSPVKQNEEQKANLSSSTITTNDWYGDYEYSDYGNKLEVKNSVLRRNSSSYPDLREFSYDYQNQRNEYSYDYQNRRRYYDDLHVDAVSVSDPRQLHHRRHRSLEEVERWKAAPPQIKTVVVDTLLSRSKEDANLPPPEQPPEAAEASPESDEHSRNERSSRKLNKDLEQMNTIAKKPPPAPPSPQSPAPPSAQPPALPKPRRTHESVARKKERSTRKLNKDMDPTNHITTPPQPPPPPPPPPPQQKSSKSDRKRGGTTGNATKDFLNSLYHKKKKKQRQKSVDNLDSILHEAQPPLTFNFPPPSPPPPPPPPPPPAPPPSVFQNLFSSKKHKRKRTITVTLAPHPQPKPNPQIAQSTPHKLPKPIKIHTFDRLDENSNSGGESPLNRIPPPPPPPPPAFFKSPAWRFVVQGDYVRVNSSPEAEETDSDVTPSAASDGGDATPFHPSPLYCPSPDVNTKAESFITSFRAKLKLEKNHSMKKREVGLSGLGPRPGPSQI
ncbi:hypothetical protein BUALT_Bualt07G0160600 [Buddleja alternifolia]|uniref:Uncharacterized protein n=1 Tax=Buddleja alternifolia TaxID=168488 RepID=A0AAV6XFI0_9LAMI|nr:hypothetical protein BUALT_Bualt07G0160600 [Buddleja alternifolia]